MSPSTFKRVKMVVHQRRPWNTQSSLGSFSLNLTDVGLFLSALALRYQPVVPHLPTVYRYAWAEDGDQAVEVEAPDDYHLLIKIAAPLI